MRNNSGKWWMLSKAGTVIEGEGNPEAASVLAAPGSEVPMDVVEKYDLTKRLDGPESPNVDSAGNPVVVVDGRAIAAGALPSDHPERVKAERATKAAGGKPILTVNEARAAINQERIDGQDDLPEPEKVPTKPTEPERPLAPPKPAPQPHPQPKPAGQS